MQWATVGAAAMLVLFAACSVESTPTPIETAPSLPSSTAPAAESSTTTAASTHATTSTSIVQDSATTTAATGPAEPIDSVESGQYCRDLIGLGYGFHDAVSYWMREGRTARMDADNNGVPCETVYPEDSIEALFGSSDARSMYLVTTVDYIDTPRFVVTGSAVRDGVICPSGTAVAIAWPEDGWFWVDRYTCDDGSGTFVAGAEVRIGTDRMYEVWKILGGTGAYVSLSGGGGADTGPAGEGLWQDHMYGRVEVPNMPPHDPYTLDTSSLYPPSEPAPDGAAGSGCTPGSAVLPDGVWFGEVTEKRPDTIRFDLACLYIGDEAKVVGERRGISWDHGYVIVNDSDRQRTLPVSSAAAVHELQTITEEDGDSYTTPIGVPYAGWPSPLGGYSCWFDMGMCPVWVAINNGVVTEILEQYFP